LEGIIRSVAAHGFSGTTVNTIAAAAGVSTGLIAHYFGCKGEILLAGYQHLCEGIEKDLARFARDHGKSTEARFYGLIEASFRPSVYEPVRLNACLEFAREARSDPAMSA